MDKPIVSIVIPAYNPPAVSFQHCIESVLGQSFREIEIILVDDGSTSHSVSEIEAWACRDSRVRVIHQDNGGVGNARNKGIDMAQGKYISFVDADDCVANCWLQKAVSEAEKQNADIVYGAVYMVDKAPDQLGDTIKQFQILTVEKEDLWRIQELMLLQEATPLPRLPYIDFGPCGKLFRADIVKKNIFPEKFPLAEDQVFNHAMLRKSERVVLTDIVAYYYIDNKGSATHQYRPDAVAVMLNAMESVRTALFESFKVKNAFFFRLLCETTFAIQLAYYHPSDINLSLYERIKRAHQTFMLQEVREALDNIELSQIADKKSKAKIWLMKKRCFLLLELFWTIKFVCKQIEQT